MNLATWFAALLPLAAVAQQPAQQPAPKSSPKQQAESPWLADYETARSRARNERRDLLMVFLAPASAGTNAEVERAILGATEFTNAAQKRFVLARFPYPETGGSLTDVELRENERLLRKYESPELPVFWLEDAAGIVYGRLGYVPAGAAGFLALLDERREAQKQTTATLARAAGLRGIARAQALAEALRHLDDHIVASTHYREMLEIIQTDADGAAGLLAEFDAIARDAAMRPLLTRTKADLEPLVAARSWDELDARIVALRTEHGDARWARQYLTFLAGIRVADGTGDPAGAAELFADALAIAPRSELAPRIDWRRRQAVEAAAAAAERAAAEADAPAKEAGKRKGRRR